MQFSSIKRVDDPLNPCCEDALRLHRGDFIPNIDRLRVETRNKLTIDLMFSCLWPEKILTAYGIKGNILEKTEFLDSFWIVHPWTVLIKNLASSEPLRVLITGAAGQVAYNVVHPLISGHAFGSDQCMTVVLLDVEAMMPVLEGLCMEMMDCCLPLLKGMVKTSDIRTAFTNVDFVIMLASETVNEHEIGSDTQTPMIQLTREHAKAINAYAKKTVKVLLAANPCHVNAYICSRHAPSIPVENISSLVRLEFNRAVGLIAHKAGVSASRVRRLMVWGETNHRALVDTSSTELFVQGQWKSASKVIYDDVWLKHQLPKMVVERTGDIQSLRPLSCALSTAMAICSHIRSWLRGTKADDWVNMGIPSDGSYGVPHGQFFGFPVKIDAQGNYQIVQGMTLNEEMTENLNKIISTLVAEQDTASAIDDALSLADENGEHTRSEAPCKGDDAVQSTVAQ